MCRRGIRVTRPPDSGAFAESMLQFGNEVHHHPCHSINNWNMSLCERYIAFNWLFTRNAHHIITSLWLNVPWSLIVDSAEYNGYLWLTVNELMGIFSEWLFIPISSPHDPLGNHKWLTFHRLFYHHWSSLIRGSALLILRLIFINYHDKFPNSHLEPTKETTMCV